MNRALILIILGVVFGAGLAAATYTHTNDIHFEARIPKADLASSDGNHFVTATPLARTTAHRLDRHEPTDTSYFSNGFTDEHHKPKIDFFTENGALNKVSISFPAPHTLSMPAFTVKVLTVRADHTIPDKYYRAKRHRTAAEEAQDENEGLSFDERKFEVVMEETLVTPNAQSDAANFALHDPTPMEDLYDFVVVILNVHPRIITSFVYELDTIPDEIFASEKMFDLTPFNTTMHMKFVAKYDAKEDALGIWVVRRPPIPDFSIIVSVDGKAELTQNVAEPSPSGQGFPSAIPHAKARRKALFRFVVHFYERPRQQHVCFPLMKDFGRQVEQKLAGAHNVKKYIEQSIPTLDGFSLRFTNDNHRDTLTVSIVQPHPISSLILSLFVSYDAKKVPPTIRHDGDDAKHDDFAERPILIFREEEHHVPYISPTEHSQFGWYSAIPMKTEALVRLADARATGKAARVPSKKIRPTEDEGHDDNEEDDKEEDATVPVDASRLANIHLSACVGLNNKEGQMHPFEEMAEWIEDFGGDIKKLAVVTRVQAQGSIRRYGRHTKANQGLAAREEMREGDQVGSVPYRVLLTTTTVEGNEWVREVMKNASAFVTKSVELGMDVQQNQHFMLMTFFLLMQPSSVYDGTNWRQYFETIPLDTRPTLPIFLSPAELAIFSFSPLMAEHVRTLTELMDAEYQTIAAQVPWFAEEVSREKYTIARSQVENRVFNISGTLVMIPALDYLGHEDDPSIALSFDDRDQQVLLQARRPIPTGSSLTVDYGIAARSKFDFFTQFGFIPKGAADVAGIRVRRHISHIDDPVEHSNIFLSSKDVASRSDLVLILREDLAAAKSDKEGDKVDPSFITDTELRNALLSLLKKELAAMPPRTSLVLEPSTSNKDAAAATAALVEAAQVLYDGQRTVLEQHITWASDTKIPL